MPHHLDLYVKADTAIHRLDPRAKMVAAAGFLTAALIAPIRPLWPAGGLLLVLVCVAALARLPARVLGRRLLAVSLLIGLPFALSRLGGEQTRLAGEAFAVKSLLVAIAFAVLLATTRALDLLAIAGRLPLLAPFGQLGEFTLRGVDLLAEEVVRSNRAWALRAPGGGLRVRVSGLVWASTSLLARAATRSDRVGAAMVLRGFRGSLPASPPTPLPWRHLAAGVALALISLGLAGAGRWG